MLERSSGGSWAPERQAGADQRVVLAEPALSFSVDDLYAGVTLEPR